MILGGHDGLGAARRLRLPRGRPRAQDLPARGPLGGVPRPRARDRPLLPRVREHARARSSGSSRRRRRRCAAAPSCWCCRTAPPTRATAATSTRTWRWPPWTSRCASTWSSRARSNLRRRCGVVLRSAALRNVHDTVLALGLGADGVCPYTMVEVGLMDDYRTDVSNLCAALRKGIEKVISTIGIHEVRGYARLFVVHRPEAGADRDLRHARLLRLASAAAPGSPSSTATATSAGASWPGPTRRRPGKTFRFYPKVYKAAVAAAERRRLVRGLLAARARASRPSSRSRCATCSSCVRTGRRCRERERRGRPALLSDRDLVDELRLPGRGGLPRRTPRRPSGSTSSR